MNQIQLFDLSGKKLKVHGNPIDQLAYALALALTAPAGREADADALAQQYAAGLSRRQITAAQRHALALVTR